MSGVRVRPRVALAQQAAAEDAGEVGGLELGVGEPAAEVGGGQQAALVAERGRGGAQVLGGTSRSSARPACVAATNAGQVPLKRPISIRSATASVRSPNVNAG